MPKNQCQLAFHLARGTNSNRSGSKKSASYRMNDKFRGVQRRGATGLNSPVLPAKVSPHCLYTERRG